MRQFKIIIYPLLVGSVLLLNACVKPKVVQYNPDDFINANRVVVQHEQVKLPVVKVKASYGYGNDPKVVGAYHKFSKAIGEIENDQDNTLLFLQPFLSAQKPYKTILISNSTGISNQRMALSTCNFEMSEPIPNGTNRSKILLPTILPTERLAFPSESAFNEMASSGRLVPNPMMMAPTKDW